MGMRERDRLEILRQAVELRVGEAAILAQDDISQRMSGDEVHRLEEFQTFLP